MLAGEGFKHYPAGVPLMLGDSDPGKLHGRVVNLKHGVENTAPDCTIGTQTGKMTIVNIAYLKIARRLNALNCHNSGRAIFKRQCLRNYTRTVICQFLGRKTIAIAGQRIGRVG